MTQNFVEDSELFLSRASDRNWGYENKKKVFITFGHFVFCIEKYALQKKRKGFH